MFVLRNTVAIGYSGGRVVLSDATNMKPTKYLSIKESFFFIALINLEDEFQRYDFLVTNKAAIDRVDAKRSLKRFIPTIADYINDLEDDFPYDFSLKRKVDVLRLTKTAGKTNLDEYRLDFPTSAVWVPTWKCNRSCLYCGVSKVRPAAEEERIPIERMYTILDELVAHGIKALALHGGEPLFHYGDEIFPMIKYLNSHGVTELNISTKNHITPEMARKLNDTGLRYLQLSLDAVDDDILYKIFGERNYLAKFNDSVHNLQSVGIMIKVNIVVSKLNYRNIPDLLRHLNSLVINVVGLSPYREGPINLSEYSLSEDEENWLQQEIDALSPELVFSDFLSEARDAKFPAVDRPVCEAGRLSILILPNGDVCYCDYLSEMENYIFGNLTTQSVQEVWDSPELNNFLHPCKKDFEGTSCHSCEALETCVLRGLCFLKTPKDRVYGPDNRCLECRK